MNVASQKGSSTPAITCCPFPRSKGAGVCHPQAFAEDDEYKVTRRHGALERLR